MAKGDGPKGKGGTRRCPLCAETVRADARKCRFCGSTIVDLGDAAPAVAREEPAEAATWAAPGPDDVGLPGLGAVVGALAGFGIGAWMSEGAGVLLAACGAAVGFGLGWTRDPRRALGGGSGERSS